MKKLYAFIIVLISLIILICSLFLLLIIFNKPNSDTKLLSDLQIRFQHEGYVIALEKDITIELEKENDYMREYAIYKNTDNQNYKKIIDLPVEYSYAIESTFIIWIDKTLYFLRGKIQALNVETNEIINVSDKFSLEGDISLILGYDKEYIYVKIHIPETTKEETFAKIKLDLTEANVIEENEVPKNINKK